MAELISAIASLLWPLFAVAAILVFRGSIKRVMRTAERRQLEVEVGGQRLTMRELNDQQNALIQDLQQQVTALRKQIDGAPETYSSTVSTPPPHEFGADDHPSSPDGHGAAPAPAHPAPTETPPQPGQDRSAETSPPASATSGESAQPEPVPPQTSQPEQRPRQEPPPQAYATSPEPYAVLWVDDHPKTHAMLSQQLHNNGVRVTKVEDSTAALEAIEDAQYRLVVTDMGRRENGRFRADAGLELLRELRDIGVEIPVVVYCSRRGEEQYGAQARALGAVAVTSSAVEMRANFENFGLL